MCIESKSARQKGHTHDGWGYLGSGRLSFIFFSYFVFVEEHVWDRVLDHEPTARVWTY